MIDCALISIPPLFYNGPHIAPGLLKAYAEIRGFNVKCFNPTLDMVKLLSSEHLNEWPYNDFKDFDETYDLDAIINEWADNWLSFSPKIIGLSTHVWASEFFLVKICKVLRERTTAKIIMGGPATIELGKAELDKGLVDYYVVGDGEDAFINALEGKFDHPSFNSNKPHAIDNDTFQNLPNPDYSDIDFEEYRSLDDKQNRIFLIGTRGCVYDCAFCNVPTLMKYRYKDGAKFANEVKEMQEKYNPEWIEFADSLINGSMREYRKLIKELSKLNLERPTTTPKIIAFYRIRPIHQTAPEDFKLMAESGFYRLKIGVESGSDTVRNDIGKTETNEDIFYTLDLCRQYGIKVNLLIIVGYPTETKEDFIKTMDMLHEMNERGFSGTIDRAVVNELYISTDTKLSTQVDELEIIDAESNTKWSRTLPNGEVLNLNERRRRLNEVTSYIKNNFSGKIMIFSDSDTKMEDTDNEIRK